LVVSSTACSHSDCVATVATASIVIPVPIAYVGIVAYAARLLGISCSDSTDACGDTAEQAASQGKHAVKLNTTLVFTTVSMMLILTIHF
jgi:hypothetical protein